MLGVVIDSENMTYALVALFVDVILLVTNIVVIAVIMCSKCLRDVIGAYFVSLSISDCLLSVLVLPLGEWNLIRLSLGLRYSLLIKKTFPVL